MTDLQQAQANLARAEAHLHELRALFTSALARLGAVCGALGVPADEPAPKLAAAALRLRSDHRRLLAAAGAVCDCAHPSGNGHWFVLNRELAALQTAVDAAEAAHRGKSQMPNLQTPNKSESGLLARER